MQRDALLTDPVSTRLAALLCTTTARVDHLTGLAFAAVLEGVACLFWIVALRLPLPNPLPGVTAVKPPVQSAVTGTTDIIPSTVTPVLDATDEPGSHARHGESR